MMIEQMFEKPIDRNIKGVIKVGQKDEDTIFQELNEYVVTKELLKHFRDFFHVYAMGIDAPTDDIGVWISGFFGSGKSHFLKILSYILDQDMDIRERKPIDYFIEDRKIIDPLIIADMKKASSVSTDVVLFNIDSKDSSKNDKNSLLNVFLKVFNELRGYSEDHYFLADLERKLDEDNLYDDFKEEFKNINGLPWVEVRSDYYFITDDIKTALCNINFMSSEEANNWIEKAEDNFSISIEEFAENINEYCNKKGNNHHIVFLVDEVGQYIGDNVHLMLNLQSLVEDLGSHCHGKAWVVVTSQQDIDSIVKVKGQDFSKIQGRFKTRLNLSSANVDEVIRKRILKKTDTATKTLESAYPTNEAFIKNIISFENSAEMKTYTSAKDYAEIYPFVPYQFNLLQYVLTSIREHGATGKHLAEGERSMLDLFQQSAIRIMEKDENNLVPFNYFYDALDKFIDHDHRSVIIKAKDNEHLDDFDVELLKVLFMIKYVKEIKSNLTNLTTLMVETIDEDRVALTEKIQKSLKKLANETLIQKNGDFYSFLTNEEQDINRAIKNENVEIGEVLQEISDITYNDIIDYSKYNYDKHHNFEFNKSVDDSTRGNKHYDIGLRIITPYYTFDKNENTLVKEDEDQLAYNVLRELSKNNKEAIFHFKNDILLNEISESIQIKKYLRKNSADMPNHLKLLKQEELKDQQLRISLYLEESLKNADIYIDGDKTEIPEKNSKDRIDTSLKDLIKKIYFKLDYMDFEPEKSDIVNVIEADEFKDNELQKDEKYNTALNDIEEYLKVADLKSQKTQLKDILNRYSKAPYGYNELEIEWLVAKLYSQKRIKLIKNNNEITRNTNKTTEIVNFLTDRQFKEKILIFKRKETSKKEIKDLKEVLKDGFSITNTSNNDEKLVNMLHKGISEKINKINECKMQYKLVKEYPGKNIINESGELFKNLNNQDSNDKFITTVCNNKDEIIEYNEDLEPIFEFFEGTQKQVFKEACDVYSNYKENLNFINNEEIEKYISQIKEIIAMQNPYRSIQKLPELSNKYNLLYNQIIEEEKLPVVTQIDQNLNDLLEQLNTEDLKLKFEDNFTKKFTQLKEKLEKSKDISQIKGIPLESNNIYNKCINQFTNYINKLNTKKENKTVKNDSNVIIEKVTPIKNVNIHQLITKSTVKIETEEDIDNFLDDLKNEIEKELHENKIIKINL